MLLIVGVLSVNFLDRRNTLTLTEKYVMGFIFGIALNSFLLFIFAWSGISIGVVKFIDIILLLGLAFMNYRNNIWRRLVSYDAPAYRFTKRDWFMIPIVVLILFKAFFSFFNSTHVPSYFDDEKGNWNIKSKIIYHAGIISTSSGSEAYLGGGGHMGYPLNFILYKAYVADFMGTWDESYINLITFLIFNLVIVLVIFSFPNRLFWVIVGYLIYSIPLVSWHSGTSYYDLMYACFYLLSLIFLLRYISTKDDIFLILIGICLYSAIFTKNEGMILITPSILLGVGYYLFRERTLKKSLYLVAPMLLIIPHLIYRWIYSLPFNPMEGAAKYGFHSDSLSLFFTYFTQWGSYNIFWFVFFALTIYFFRDLWKEKYRPIAIAIGSLIFAVFVVFSFTNNYQFLLDQTTINRTLIVLMMSILYFYASLAHDRLK